MTDYKKEVAKAILNAIKGEESNLADLSEQDLLSFVEILFKLSPDFTVQVPVAAVVF